MNERRCPFCGEVHDPGPIADATLDSVFSDWSLAACPNVPPGHFYIDDVFATGPRGRLHRLVLDE